MLLLKVLFENIDGQLDAEATQKGSQSNFNPIRRHRSENVSVLILTKCRYLAIFRYSENKYTKFMLE